MAERLSPQASKIVIDLWKGKTMPAPQSATVPHSYVIIETVTHCRCGSLHTTSQVFSKTHIRSSTGATYVPNLRPIRDPSDIVWNLPIETLKRPVVQLPFCHDCSASVSLAHLPSPPIPDRTRVVGSNLVDADDKPKPKVQSPAFTIDDL